jgi:large subunit ribosomal protein L32e
MVKSPKQKPRVKREHSSGLKSRKSLKMRKPSMSRQEGYRHKKLKKGWRRPRGKHSKLRMREKPRGGLPGSGHGSPRAVRGLNRLGYKEIRITNVSDLSKIKPESEVGLLASTLGRRKRDEILKLAIEKGIHVINA